MLCVESSLEPNEEITAITTITIIIQNHHFLYIGFFFFLGGCTVVVDNTDFVVQVDIDLADIVLVSIDFAGFVG